MILFEKYLAARANSRLKKIPNSEKENETRRSLEMFYFSNVE